MDYKLRLETYVKNFGRGYLFPIAIGIIASINESYFHTSDEKACEIGNVLTALDMACKDDSLPYEKRPTAETVRREG